MSARHARPSRWHGTSRVLAFGVASLAIAAVGTTPGTGAFYYDAVHLPVSITAAPPAVAPECQSEGYGPPGPGMNDAVLAVGTDGDDTLVLTNNIPTVDKGTLAESPLAVRIAAGSTAGWKLYHLDVSQPQWTVGAEMQMSELDTKKDHAFVVLGGAGDDVIVGGNKYDCLVGGSGVDLLYGGNSTDILIGGAGADWIFGGNAKDQECSAGDHLFGGNGKDRCEQQDEESGSGPGKGKNQSPTSRLVEQPSEQPPTTPGDASGSTPPDGTTTDGTTVNNTTTGDTTPPTQPDQAAGPSQEGTTG